MTLPPSQGVTGSSVPNEGLEIKAGAFRWKRFLKNSRLMNCYFAVLVVSD